MKLLAVFAFVVAVAVAASPEGETRYAPNKEYVYEYETEALTGIPAASRHLAGIKVKAAAHMQVKGANKVLLQLRNIKVCAVNEEIPNLHPLSPVSSGEACSPITGPENEVLLQHLAKPIRFKWENGQVSLMQVDADDAYWSVNIKRSVLQLLEVNLQELEAIPELPPYLMNTVKAAVPSAAHKALGDYFRVMEEDLTGDCMSIYAILKIPGPTPILNVTKVRNYEACERKPLFQYGVLAAMDCKGCSEKVPFTSQSYVNYELAGDRQAFLIRSAIQQGTFIAKPLATVDGQAMTFTNQRLILAEVTPNPTPIALGKTRVQKEPFMFELPSRIAEIQPAAAAANPAAAAKLPLVKQYLEKIVQETEPLTLSLSVPEIVADLTVQLRQLPLESLTELVMEVAKSNTPGPAWKKREIILDVLPVLGRNDVVPVLKRLLQENAIAPARAAIMINLMALTAEPAPFLITELLALTKEPIAAPAEIKHCILLAAGALVNTLNKIFVSAHVSKEIAVPARHLIFEEFKKILVAANTPEDKIIILKALGNAGLVEFVPLLEPLIKDTNEQPDVRAKAIYALRRLTPAAKHKIHGLLLPLVLNPSEAMPVRLAAVVMTMHTRPEGGILTMIAQHIPKEPSVQVASFIYSYMKAIAQSELPCNRRVAEDARAAMKEIPLAYPGLPYSKMINIEAILSHFHHIGADISLDLVTPGVSVLPETIITRVNAYFAKSIFNLFEIGVESEGIQTILRNLIGPESQWLEVLKGQKSLAEIISPVMNVDIESITQLLGRISEREMSSLSAHIYMKLFDTEIRYAKLNTQCIKDIILFLERNIPTALSALNTGLPFDMVKVLSLVDQAVMWPTPAGLPVSLNMSHIGILQLAGSVKVEGVTSLSQLVSGAPNVNIKMDIKPKILYEVSGKMGVDIGIVKAATALRARISSTLPIKGEAIAEAANGKVQVSLEVPQAPVTLIKHDITPLAIVATELITPQGKFYEKVATPIFNPKKVVPVVVDSAIAFWGEALGIEVAYKGKYAKSITPATPMRYLCMPHELEVVVRPGRDAPKFVELTIAYVVPDTPEGEAIKMSVIKGHPVSNSWFSMASDAPAITFDPVTPAPSISSPIKRQVIVMMKTKEHSAPRFIASQITLLAEPTFLKHQLDIQLGYKIAASTAKIMKLSTILEIPKILVSSGPAPTSNEELATVQIAYGPEGNTVEYLKIKSLYKVLAVPEEEYMRQTLAEEVKPWKIDTNYKPPAETPFTYSRASRYTPSALPDYRPAKPIQFIYEVDYKPIPIPGTVAPYLRRYLWKLVDLPEYFWPTAEVALIPEPNTPQKAFVTITALPTTAMAEVAVKCPGLTTLIKGIPLPWSLLWHPYHDFPILPEAIRRVAGKTAISGDCAVVQNNVKTFDAVEYTLPDTTCETILAQDCSSKKMFRVTAEKSPAAPTKKIVKFYVGSMTIEVIPSGSWANSGMEVKADGAPVSLVEGVPVEVKNNRNKVICTAIKKGPVVEIIEKKLNIKIEADGEKVSVKLPMWFRGVACGMCGNFDSEKVADVKGPNKEEYAHPEHAIVDYVIPSPSCDINDLKKRFMSTIIPNGVCSPAPKTVYLERTLEGRPHACFSVEPIQVCPGTCRPSGQMSVQMSFHCLPADLPSTQQLLDRLARGPLPPMTGKAAQITDTVITSSSCLPSN